MSHFMHALSERFLPDNIDAERYVLGAALNDPNAWIPIAELLDADDFSLEKHKRIFLRLGELFECGMQLSTVVLAQDLNARGQLAEVDGLSYLVTLGEIGSIANLERMCGLVRDCATRRRGIQAASLLIDELYSDETSEQSLASAERVAQILSDTARRKLKAHTVADVIEASGGINSFLAPESRPGIALPYRFDTIHRTLGGLRRGKLILLAARPAVGKSALVHEWLLHAASNGKRGLLVTLEMSSLDVLHRELTALSRVSSYRFREGRLEPAERSRLLEQTTWLSSLGSYLRFLDQSVASVPGISAVLRSLLAKGEPVDFLVIDYLQLIQPTGQADNRVQEVSKISRGLKTISQLFDIPCLAICNLNRKGMKPTDEPQLDWLRDSGQLEFDADQILFLWPEKEPNEFDEERSVAWKVAKNKDGQENRGTLRFHLKYCRFMDEGDAVPPPNYLHGSKLEARQ